LAVESHGLAFILAVVFWRVAPARFWHLIAMATSALLGTANLVFWQIFPDTDAVAMGYVATSLHWVFAVTQLFAAAFAPETDKQTLKIGTERAIRLG
jgi:ethanolamine ammonia-lyase large subunit